ncbi:MAG TPA: NAD-dependent epimerase [Saprospiraceae bacterium]|nr:NAD-dependent epimerase [Saprospiraceae bacterium]HMQ83744.1 NAD-dependent epimerase [Saprospiraceae bacterium]
MKILVTGTAGFIGFHLAKRLAAEGHDVVGLDSINSYYDPDLKFGRLQAAGFSQAQITYGQLLDSEKYSHSRFVQLSLEDQDALNKLFADERFDWVCHLAAQAGVRYSLEAPHSYIDSNIKGFLNLLECCRSYPVKHFVFASSSSVYGLNKKIPFATTDSVDHPASIYAATKKSNELMAHTYSHLFGIPTTGLRFFTVYGPWGRPDMAYFLFTKAILENQPIKVFNHGKMSRDFTYVDDVVEGVIRVLAKAPNASVELDDAILRADQSSAPYRIYNIGNNQPVTLMDFIHQIEVELGKEAQKIWLPIQPGDVEATYADVSGLENDFNYKPKTTLAVGIANFVAWYKAFYC